MALVVTGLFSQTVLVAFCMVLGSGLTVIGMSHFLVIGGLEHHAWKTRLQQAEEFPLALGLCIRFQDCSLYPCWVKKCFSQNN